MPTTHTHSHRHAPDALLFAGYLAVLTLAPLPRGAEPDWAWALIAVGMFLIAMAWIVQYLRGRVAPAPALYAARWPLAMLVIWAIYVAAQLVPLPLAWLRLLSPEAAAAYAYVGAEHAPLSVDQYATFKGLLKTLLLMTTFTLTLLLVSSRERARWLLATILIAATVQAVYGVAMVLSGIEWGVFAEKEIYRGTAIGTHINKNLFAGHLAMAIGLGLGLMLTLPGEAGGTSRRARLVGVLTWLTSWKAVLRLLLVLLVIGLVMSRSRMGNIAFFTGLLAFGVLGLLSKRALPKKPFLILVISIVLIDALIISQWFGLERLAQRLEQTSVVNEQRTDVAIQVMPAIEDYWLTGSGLGSFQSVFPRYRGPDVLHFWNHAHNDYLEFLLEAGVVGATPLTLFLLINLGRGLRRCWRAEGRTRWSLAMGSMLASVALLIQVGADFNLQMPANAMLFMVALGLFWFEAGGSAPPIGHNSRI